VWLTLTLSVVVVTLISRRHRRILSGLSSCGDVIITALWLHALCINTAADVDDVCLWRRWMRLASFCRPTLMSGGSTKKST